MIVAALAIAAGTVTYSRDIAPLVNDRCAMCHHAGGSAPFALETYTDVKQHASQIARVTASSRVMPIEVLEKALVEANICFLMAPRHHSAMRNVAGPRVDVHQILRPNSDPHTYEPRPSDIQGAADAKLVFANGDDLDGWIDQVVSESGSGAKIIDLGAAVPVKLPGESSGAEASTYDPHWWHDPRNAEAAVTQIRKSLTSADPPEPAVNRRTSPG